MYMLKICRCCDAIIGELDMDEAGGIENTLDIVGNVAYTLCPQCMNELNIQRVVYHH